ncbi:mechanosensitive ion channel family protein [Sphingobacterium bovistauri]|uniref:Mechanosensitive ion channel n=1 Tax=Sphingobacterium bovistauri TaxID=2781959 RepID=A0ABS7Z8W0_9SPHI|nr:mechanosensitive ion channel domain-containing protein [Sphingobacterium bovistauri]MCA5006438.1 mechanosensitive ion channel [Sphingobacterium bovistauri]
MKLLQIESTIPDASQFMDSGQIWVMKIKDMALDYVPKILGAILVYLIGSWIISRIANVARAVMLRKKFDVSLQTFLGSLIKVSLTIMMFLAIVGMLGVNITSFAALLAGAGLAIGAALNGSLGNLAGGVMLMIFKPFKVGDIIEAQGVSGVVTEIGIFCTTILSPENKTIILPNGSLSTGVITNFNTHGNLRVDLKMGIALTTDIDRARVVATQAMLSHSKVLQSPAPEVSVLEVGNGMTTLAIRPYTTQADYWDVYFGVQELVKKAFDKEDIDGPVPTQIVINKTNN